MSLEFTPEINQDFYNRLAAGIQKQGGYDVGQARSEALSRGLTGDPFEASLTGMARANTAGQLADLNANLEYNVAGMNREERLMKQGQQYQTSERQDTEQWQSKENERSQQAAERMAQMHQGWQSDMANTQNRQNQQSALWQLPVSLAGMAAGGGFGGFAGLMAGGMGSGGGEKMPPYFPGGWANWNAQKE